MKYYLEMLARAHLQPTFVASLARPVPGTAASTSKYLDAARQVCTNLSILLLFTLHG